MTFNFLGIVSSLSPMRLFFLLLFFPLAGIAQKKSAMAKFLAKEKNFLPVPAFSASTENGVMLGVGLDYYYNTGGKNNKTNTRPSVSWIQGLYSTRGQFLLEGLSSTYTPKEKMYIYFKGAYADTYEKFWGYSKDMFANSEYVNYTFSRLYLQPKFFFKIKNKFFIGPTFYYSQYDNFKTDTIIALSKGALADIQNSKVASYGIGLLNDKRDNQFSPIKGRYIEVGAMRNHDLNTKKVYTTYLLDLRKYHTLKNHNFLYQLYMMRSRGSVPVAEQFRLGGSGVMRGMFQGRLRDANLMAVQAEYRYPLKPWLKWAAFAASGQTFGNIDKSGMALTAGTGLRILFNKNKSVYLRGDIAVSSKGELGYYFKVGDAF